MENISEDFIDRPVVMVGLMGAGKTSVGRALARRLGIPFVDSDKEIELAAGCSVVDIFSMYGEEEFRRVEQRLIEPGADEPQDHAQKQCQHEPFEIDPEVAEEVFDVFPQVQKKRFHGVPSPLEFLL